MQIEEAFEEYLSKFKIHLALTARQMKRDMANDYGINEGSVIPSDYCYNIVNLDPKAHDFKAGHPRLLIQIKRGLYKYVGRNYPYDGFITHKGKIVGKWDNGKYEFYTDLKR